MHEATATSSTVSGTGILNAQSINIYPQVAAGQTVPVGTYTDTITVSVASTLHSTVTTTFTVTAIVPAACTISASALKFGVYSGTQIDSTSVLTVTCTNLTTFNIGLSAGTSAGATVTIRRMTSPAPGLFTLNYTLFSDSMRTLNWGNTAGTDTLLLQGTGIAQTSSVYGRLPSGQSANPAVYTDAIISTITY